MKGYIYILKDDHGRFYVGSTSNLERRMSQHRYGGAKTTRGMVNPKLVLSQEFCSMMLARKVERRIKKLKRKDYIEKMVSDGYIKMANQNKPL